MKHYDTCHVYVASVAVTPPNTLTHTAHILLSLAAERRALHHDAAGGDAARHRRRDEVPVGHELRAQRPRRPEHPGEQQLGLQGLRFWPVALPGRHFRRPHLHKLAGESRRSAQVVHADRLSQMVSITSSTICDDVPEKNTRHEGF